VSPTTRKLAMIGALGLTLAASAAQAQNYPAQPVRIVVPYAAGGGVDAMARFLTKGLEQRLGQTFFIENRGGSATTTGAAHVARSAPDGYTLLIGSSSTYAIAVSLYKRLPYDPTKDLTPISLVAAVPFVLVVHPSVPVNSVMELVALAKSKPGVLNYASAGVGAPHHIYAELFKTMTGIDIRNISYRGGGPALQDVVAGHVPITFADAGQGPGTDPGRQGEGARRHRGEAA
jgi:tripartite-type tricarboxylate transporter receptor subunit TctC